MANLKQHALEVSIVRTLARRSCQSPTSKRAAKINAPPSRGGLLPARPPLRTVLESFPSYGSSLDKANHTGVDPPCDHLVRLGNTWVVAVGRSAPLGSSAETHQSTCVDRHLLSRLEAVPQCFLPFQTRPTWAYPAALPLALASSVLPMLLLLTRLAVRSAQLRTGTGLAAFPCSATITMSDLGSLCTPAVQVFASGHREEPDPDCLPFGPSLEQSLVACSISRCLRAFISFWPCHPILALPRIETSRFRYIVGKASDPRRNASCACFARIPVAKHGA